jgi:hypothetical protein
MASKQCRGKKNLNSQCKNQVVDDENYCEKHLYFKTYTEDMMKNLRKCIRCANMFYYESLKQCPPCTEHSKEKSNKISIERKKLIKCEGITKEGTNCTYNQLQNSKYCCNHQYMNDYTEDMIKNLRQCSCCKSYRYFNSIYSTCDECREYRHNERLGIKSCRSSLPTCKKEGCKNKVNTDGEYCGKHRTLQLREDAEKDGYKLCGGNHSCMNRIKIESKHTHCDECLQKHRDEDKMRYQKEKQDVEEFNSEHDDMMKCIKCGKEFNVDERVKDIHGNISNKCKDCFKKQQDIESKRPERHREWAKEHQEFLKNPERVAKKKQWKKDNVVKIREYWRNYRKMLQEKLGTDEYHALMAEKMRSYWERNPEKKDMRNDKARRSVSERFGYYTYSAGIRKKEWTDEMTQDYCESLFKSQCHYCGKKYVPNGYLLGIDRVDNTKGYCIDNCVACCDVCNYMKRTHSKDNFIKMCMHIYCKLFDETSNMYPDIFKGRKTMPTFEEYIVSASKRNIDITLNSEDHIRIMNQCCYVCGHIDKKEDYNGIDRIDSDKAYQRNNCKACCATCNYLKNDLSIIEFISHVIKIVWYQDGSLVFNCDAETYNQFVNSMVSFGVEHSNILDIAEPYETELFEVNDEKITHKKRTHEEKLEYDRNKSREIDTKKCNELGDEEFKKLERIKKALQRGKSVDENGYTVKTKKPLTATERSRLCRERKKQLQQPKKQLQQPKKQISDIDQRILDDIKQSGIKMV